MSRFLPVFIFIGTAWPMVAIAHPATERYIPLGASPGVSTSTSYTGEIESVNATGNGFTMNAGDGEKYINMDDTTHVYLDYEGADRSNGRGTPADCQESRFVEVYLDDDGTARWVKIRMP